MQITMPLPSLTRWPRHVPPIWPWLLCVWIALLGTACQSRQGTAAEEYTSYLPAAPRWQPITLQPYAVGLYRPTSITHAGDDRLFVTEKWGQVRFIHPGGLLATLPFLDIRDRVNRDNFEQGLLGLAFSPGYAQNGLLFVTYSRDDGSLVLSRFAHSGNDEEYINPDSEIVLLAIPHEQPYHYGGDLAFGPDGYLYLSVGDGGAAANASQALNSLLGKILRLDVSVVPYAIPPDNPYGDDPAARPEIWASGLRNPWRISFDAASGDLFVADVGESAWEEVNLLPASAGGLNLGWRCYEGWQPFDDNDCAPADAYTFPIFAYHHDALHCAITGGYRYYGSQYAPLQGIYIYSDFCSRQILGLVPDANGVWRSSQMGPITNPPGTGVITFGQDHNGELYVGLFNDAVIYHVTHTGAPAP